jgi:hypothetical protein
LDHDLRTVQPASEAPPTRSSCHDHAIFAPRGGRRHLGD